MLFAVKLENISQDEIMLVCCFIRNSSIQVPFFGFLFAVIRLAILHIC